MKNSKIKHQLKGLRYLDAVNLDQKMAVASQPVLVGDKIFIDLSQCQFAELGALAKLLLIVEGYLRNQHAIYVALPTAEYTEGERLSERLEHNEELKISTRNKRRAANNFLKNSGFVNALQEIGITYDAPIHISENYDFIKEGFNERSFQDSFSTEFGKYLIDDEGYRFLMPFKWIDCSGGALNDVDDLAELENKIDKILGNESRGLDGADVKGIRNVIISELVKNVKEHSERTHAIFTIGLISSARLFDRNEQRKTDPLERNYLKWLKEHNIGSQVEIYFGDSGVGLLNQKYVAYAKKQHPDKQLSKKEQLEFAFTKWSTSKNGESRRGTKGLYRLLRIVNRYNGLVCIDTLTSSGGFVRNKGEYRSNVYEFRGTLINIKMNPFHEIRSIRYTLDHQTKREKWTSRKYKVDAQLSDLELIKRDICNSKNLLMLLDSADLDFSMPDHQQALETLLYEVSFDARPTNVVIYLIKDIGDVTMSTIVNSVQNRILNTLDESLTPEIKDRDLEEIHDPVFVLGSNNNAFWYGGSQELIGILQESYDSGIGMYNSESYNALTAEKRDRISLYLRSYDSELIRLDADGNVEFNFRNVEAHFEQTVSDALAESREEMRCTPKLYIVNKWIETSDLLKENEFGFALCLYLKYRTELERQGLSIETLERDDTFILIDHSLQYKLARKFVELVGIKAKNIRNIESDIDSTIPKRTKLFSKHSKVIFLTTFIQSSETIRRLVKYAKRDFATPQVILSLGNFRVYNVNELETWSDRTQIVSCYQKEPEESARNERNQPYFENKYQQLSGRFTVVNPDLTTAQYPSRLAKASIEVDKDLIAFLQKNKLLHYNHYGFYNKRHFTFLLNKIGILNIESFLWTAVTDAFRHWLDKREIKEYKIYVNRSILGEDSGFLKALKEFSNNNVVVFDSSIQYVNDRNVIYFDFGILTGQSINEFMSKVYNAEHLFVCLLFNQSVNSNKDLLDKIDAIKYKTLAGHTGITKLQTEYLYHLPLSFFTSENCPICEHRRALDYFKIDDKYLFDFSEDRQERLKQNSADDILEISYPVDFYYSTDKKSNTPRLGQELSSNIIMQMYELKILLENAKNFTSSRIDLYKMIYELHLDLESELQNAESRVYSLLHYLSHEINWFQQEPLIFRDLRILVSEIALRVAIIPKSDLMLFFDESNTCAISSEGLATRYKYAAISILRSTDKLLFCESIFKIIFSSVHNGTCSHNLLQNTLYHISSFYKNTYNRSEVYYNAILSNLNEVLERVTLAQEQQSAINSLLVENRNARKNVVSVREEPAKFKEMKDQWEAIYIKEMPDHPEPFEEFMEMSISRYDPLFEDGSGAGLSQEQEQLLSNGMKRVIRSWKSLKKYIESTVTYYFRNYLYCLSKSSFIRSQHDYSFDLENHDQAFRTLDELVRRVDKDWKSYPTFRLEYNKALKYIQDTYISKEGLGGFTIDSNLLELLSEFPCEILAAIHETFQVSEFPRMQVWQRNKDRMTAAAGQYNIYFPDSKFRTHLRFILTNIHERINAKEDTSIMNLRFVISTEEENFLHLSITYDCTDNYREEPKHTGGSLSAFKAVLQEFDGGLSYSVPSAKDKKFRLDIRFLRYE